MAKGIYVGAGGVARRMKKAYVGVAGKAAKVNPLTLLAVPPAEEEPA